MSTLHDRRMIEASTVIEQLDDDSRLRRRLERDPGDHIASTQLEAIYRARGDWSSLVELLLDRAETLEAFEAARVLVDVAEIYTTKLGDSQAALVVLQTAFSSSPDNARLADRLCQLAVQTGQWGEVVDLFVVEAAKLSGLDDATASELWLRVAWAHLESGHDVEAAGAALERVTDLHSSSALAIVERIESCARSAALLGLLADICERCGDQQRQFRVLNRLLSLLGSSDGAVGVHLRIGKLLIANGDVDTAEWHLVEALRRAPSRSDVATVLMDLYKERGQYLKAARLLEVCREAAQNPIDRVKLSLEAANIYAEALDQHTMAADLYESALALDPEHVGAALPLAERYYREERWFELEPIIDMLVRRASALSDGSVSLADLCCRAGETAAHVGNLDKARRYFDSALSMRPGDETSLAGLADVLVRSQNWDEAAAAFKSLLSIHQQRGDHTEIAATLANLARCAEERHDPARARDWLSQAAELAPDSRDVSVRLAELCEQTGSFERAIELKRALLALSDDPQRVRLLADIGRITSRNLRDPARAITIFQQALEIDPRDREVLHQLVEHYSAAGWWEDAVEAIYSIVDLEKQPVRKGKYLQAAAVILRSQLGDVTRAADCYDDALDCFYGQGAALPESLRPSCMRAFQELGSMLSGAGAWKRLEQSYRKMIRRIDPNDAIAADLWHGLGEIYRRNLGHADAAIASFEVASKLDDKRLTRHRILVDLYESAGPDKAMEAIGRRQRLLQDEPLEVQHYKALRKLYARTKQYDRAWTACRVLDHLGAADDEERAFLAARTPRGYELPLARLTPAMWRLVRDPREDSHITAVLGLVAEEAVLPAAVPQRSLGLDRDVSGTEQFANLAQSVAGVLDVPVPDVFVHPASAGDVLWANVRKGKSLARTVAVGSALYRSQEPRHLVAALAKALVYSRPAYLLRVAAQDPREIEAVFLAAAALSRRDVPVPPALAGRVAAYRKHFEARLPAPTRRMVAAAVDRYVAAGRAYDFVEWSRAVDGTARRAALVVSSNLPLSLTVGGVPADRHEVAELLRFSVSDAHASLRSQLGLSRD